VNGWGGKLTPSEKPTTWQKNVVVWALPAFDLCWCASFFRGGAHQWSPPADLFSRPGAAAAARVPSGY